MTAIRPDGAAAIQCCAIRVSRLNADGSIPVSPSGMWVQDAVIKFDAKPNVLKGTEILVQTACGSIANNYRDFDRHKYWDVTLDITNPDPEASELLTSGSSALITIGGNSTGLQMPALNQANQPTGCSIELWSKAIIGSFQVPGQRVLPDGATTSGSPTLTSASGNFGPSDVGSKVTGTGIPANTTISTVTDATHVVLSANATATGASVVVTVVSLTASPWYRWVAPRVFLLPDQRTLENKALPVTFSGFAIENPNWGTGPIGDWTTTLTTGSGTPLPSGRVLQYNRDIALPTPLEPGYQASTV